MNAANLLESTFFPTCFFLLFDQHKLLPEQLHQGLFLVREGVNVYLETSYPIWNPWYHDQMNIMLLLSLLYLNTEISITPRGKPNGVSNSQYTLKALSIWGQVYCLIRSVNSENTGVALE